MKNFYDYFIKKSIPIIIPSLQRDYVQGGLDYVIRPFLTDIYRCLHNNESSTLELNYIYGYNKNNLGFIAIDGQQRLITLWLVYLFLCIKNDLKNDLNTYPLIKFDSREYADNFVTELVLQSQDEKNHEFLISQHANLSKCPWFIKSWLDDVSVRNMVNTWQFISGIFTESIQLENFTRVGFSFCDLLKDNKDQNKKINDDIYIKMNGRGKPLSYFDNLKAFMDHKLEKLKEENKIDEDFLNKWRIKIDNEWLEMVWTYRNRGEQNNENIDDEQVRLFYNLLLLYWLQTDESTQEIRLKLHIDNLKLNKSLYSEILKDLVKNDNPIPVALLDYYNLFTDDVFKFINNSLDSYLRCISVFNPNGYQLISSFSYEERFLNVKLDDKDDTHIFYHLALESGSYQNTLPYFYAIISYGAKVNKLEYDLLTFCRYMRVIRNLVCNTTINRDSNFSNVLMGIKTIANYVSDSSFYTNIINSNLYKELIGFDKEQIKEEFEKINLLYNVDFTNTKLKFDCEKFKYITQQFEQQFKKSIQDLSAESILFNAEQSLFLRGKINFLYHQNEGKFNSLDEFFNKYNNFLNYFKPDDDNKSKINSEHKYDLMKSLIYLDNNFEHKVRLTDKPRTWYKQLIIIKNFEIINKILMSSNLESNIEEYKTNFISSDDKYKDWRKRLSLLLECPCPKNYFLDFIFSRDRFDGSMKLNNIIQNPEKYKGWIDLSKSTRDSILFTAYKNKNISFVGHEYKKELNSTRLDKIEINNLDAVFLYQWENFLEFKLLDSVYRWYSKDDKIKKLNGKIIEDLTSKDVENLKSIGVKIDNLKI